MNGNDLEIECFIDTSISVESVKSIKELENTNLMHTPILFYLDEYTLQSLQSNLHMLKDRRDVYDNQIFFMIDNELDHSMVTRIIEDLGMSDPQVVTSINDENVLRYIEVYPVTDYIVNVLKVFRNNITDIQAILHVENEKSQIRNSAIHDEINSYENQINLLQTSYDMFYMRDYISIPEEWTKAKENMLTEIERWNGRKTKTNRSEDAHYFAGNLQETMQKIFGKFTSEMWNLFSDFFEALVQKYIFWYVSAGLDKEFDAKFNTEGGMISRTLPSIAEQLMSLKEEQYVVPKEINIRRLFGGNSSTEEKEPVLETTYYFVKWRDLAKSIANAYSTEIIEDYFNRVCRYETQLAEQYMKHLQELMKNQVIKKENTALKLSDEGQKIQIDNDWIEEFENLVRVIERG